MCAVSSTSRSPWITRLCAADTRSSLIVNWLATFCRDLTGRHPDVPEAASFREQARDYVRKAAPARVGDL
jgi:hypothetical protein